MKLGLLIFFFQEFDGPVDCAKLSTKIITKTQASDDCYNSR